MFRIFAIAVAIGTVVAVAPRRGGAQDSAPAPRVNREQMWFAPSAEDWKKPCLIQWQRTWDDAVRLSKETGKPILVCVNMDGEIASEHYAGVRYRQPDITKLYAPYVTVIASTYRHAPRDYDDQGRRIPCPRFGTVTCGEHIAIEPLLFEKFMDGRRIAPRHIMVELDGKETYDVFYAWDTDSVFKSIGDGIANRPPVPPTVVRGDRTIVQRVESPDSVDRAAVEAAYRDGDAALRRALLEAAVARGEEVPIEVLRLALHGFDPELARIARKALATAKAAGAVDLISEALRAPVAADEREALLSALNRFGEESQRAKTLAVLHQGDAKSSAVNVEGWVKALEGAAYEPAEAEAITEARLRDQAAAMRSEDPTPHVELAEAFLAQGKKSEDQGERRFARVYFEDALKEAKKAASLGAVGWRADSALAVALFKTGRREEAKVRAETAAQGLPENPTSWSAMIVLGLFAEARKEAIGRALRERREWPSQWLADVNAAYTVLAKHPDGTDGHVQAHYDFLRFLGGGVQAGRILDEGLERFPESAILHERYRSRVVDAAGIEGLANAYDRRLEKPEAPKTMIWYAGYASVVAAELYRRMSDVPKAREAYERAIGLFDRYVKEAPDDRVSGDDMAARAIGSRARLTFEAGDFEKALDEILAAFERRAESAATADGLNLTTVDTAKMLLGKLKTLEMTGPAERLAAALAKLSPELLALPAYEREVPPASRPADGAASRPRPRRRTE